MSEKELENNNEGKNNYISLSKINYELYQIFHNNKKDTKSIKKEIKQTKLYDFFLISMIKTKNIKEIKKFLLLKKNFYNKNNSCIILKSNIKELYKIILSKFLIDSIINSNELCKIFNFDNNIFIKKLFELLQIFYLNNLVDNSEMSKIVKFKLISCLNEDENNDITEESLDLKNKPIYKISPLEFVINYLLSFKSIKMDNKKIIDFINIINDVMKIFEEYILINFNNIYLLSNSLLFYRLIELSQISLDCIVNIIPILMKVYKFNFNINYYLNDLNEQFLLKKNENIISKNNNIISKNNFLFELFKYENLTIKEQKNLIIRNGFVFNDNINNGIILNINDSFTLSNEHFSTVISFKLIKKEFINKKEINKINQDNKIYPIYSFIKKDGSIDFIIYIESNILKMNILGKVQELFSNIGYNKTYVLWHFHQGDNKKGTSFFYLNKEKIIKKKLTFLKESYDINLGFEKVINKQDKNDMAQNNFEGIIGTFILFKDCFINDDNSNKSKFYEETLIELKCNYEDIIYINYETEFSSLNLDTIYLLKKFVSDDISRFIELIISSKSITSRDFCCCNANRKKYKANYFMDKKNDQSMITYNGETLYVNNNLITYPFYFCSTFEKFINNNGIKFLNLELYYFIGVIGSYTNINKGEKIIYDIDNKLVDLKKEKNVMYLKLQYICNLFLYCLQNMNEIQEKKNENDINYFLITLNNLISLNSKNDFKLNLMFLSSIISHLYLLINKNIFFNYFGFIFDYNNYPNDDEKVFELLFQTILIYLEEYNTNFLTNEIFSKILNFDKLYIEEKTTKNIKKLYSQLIRKCLSLSLLNNNDKCFLIYIKKLKNYSGVKQNDLGLNYNYISEEDLSDDSDNVKIPHKKSIKNIRKNTLNLINRKSSKNIDNIDIDEEKEELNNLILIYKYLKNLYLCLEEDKQTYDILTTFCLQNEENMNDFFNEVFRILSNKYEINKMNYSIKNEKNNYEGDIDNDDNENMYDDDYKNLEINDENNNDNNNIIIDEEKIKELKIAELIKSLCIRFLDDINYENNSKIITNELREKKKFTKENINNNSFKSSMKSSTNLYKAGSAFSLKTPKKRNNEHMSLTNLNSAQNLTNKKYEISNDSIDTILLNKFEFFSTFTISPYTFNSFFVSLFRNMSNKSKLKYIKNINSKSEKLYLEEKNFIITRFFSRIIIQLIQRVGEEESDTFIMGKLEFFEYVYDKFKDLLINMLDYYQDKKKAKKETLKPMINNLFCSKENSLSFYISIFDNLKKQKDMLKMLYVFNNKVIKNLNNENDNKFFDNFTNKVKNNLYNIIDNTIFKLIDPFYFKLLFDIYIKDIDSNDNNKFVFETIEYITKKFYNYKNSDLNDTKREKDVLEFNNKNLILLIYKIVFYKTKRKYLIQNIKPIVLYLVTFLSTTQFIFLKILFPIEDPTDSKYTPNKKLILEILFEIYFELYLEYKKMSKDEENEEKKEEMENQSNLFEEQIMQLLIIQNASNTYLTKNIFTLFESFAELEEDNKSKKKKKKKIWEYSICYMIDKLSVMKDKTKNIQSIINSNIISTFKDLCLLRDYAIKKYQKEYIEDENDFSVTIIFLIKLTIYIQELEKTDKNSNLLNFFIKTSELLCEDAQRLHQKYIIYNPLVSKSENQTEVYEEFKNYIINEYNLNKKYDKNDLIEKINKNEKASRKYRFVLYNRLGKAKLVSTKTNLNIYEFDRRKSFYKDMSNSYGEGSSYSKNSLKDEKEELLSSGNLNIETPKSFGRLSNLNIISSLESNNNIGNIIRVSSAFFLKKKEKPKLLEYKIVPNFLKNYIRNYFSLYFIKLLTYDEDFVNVRKLYYYLYHKEISNINKYYLNYPTRLKNRLGNNYVKHFLKKDFNFIRNEYFKYSHKCIVKRNFYPKTKYLFPSKNILEKYDYAHKDTIINKDDKTILSKNCELITYEGAVFGYIYFFQNCILFKSDIENDKRKIDNLLDCACCCMEFDFLEKNKTRIIELTEIKEVICRKFLYCWMSLEIFMKNGNNHLFNFFSEELNYEILDLLKNNGIPVIKNIKEYFDNKEYSKKWKEGKISTYNYLLLLNKFSSRTYNDSNQYPIMPWIFMEDSRIRDFDIPMSIQDKEQKIRYLQIPNDSSENDNRWHSNHYSTSAYICYYLMRTNPFTESMIKFQSNNFDVPDRQFFDIGQTLLLCEKNNNNREPIPELYTIPEIYINLNVNDFGKQSDRNFGGRIHNVEFKPYANNAYDFLYKFKNMLNTNEEVNTKINEWFDFIFGINQFNKDNISGNGLRNFNKYSYGQNIDIKKIIYEYKRNKKPESKIYSKIKEILGMVISFGQCPFQLLTDKHPKRIYKNGFSIILPSYFNNLDEQDLSSKSSSNNINESIENKENDETQGNESRIQILYDDKNKKHNIIYFKKSINNNYLYCICNNKEMEVYNKQGKNKEYKYKKKINVSKNYLLFKKNNYGYPILKPQYLFCELKEEHFIFCRYLDNTIKFVLPNMEFQFLLDSFITSIIRINEKEFITGDNKGRLYHWFIDLDDILNSKLKLIKRINSNYNSITSILYNEQLNIIISSDKNTVIIRNFHDFEFLTFFDINDNHKNNKNNENIEINENEIIVDIKMSNYDLLYILINKGNDDYKLKGYSLNGICFGQFEEKITNFDLTEEGKIIVGLSNLGLINILNPINFKVLFSRFVIPNEECYFYNFYFEKPNVLFFGYKDKEGSKIRIVVLNNEEMKQFI